MMAKLIKKINNPDALSALSRDAVAFGHLIISQMTN